MEYSIPEYSTPEEMLVYSIPEYSTPEEMLVKLQNNDIAYVEVAEEEDVVAVLDMLRQQPNQTSLKKLYVNDYTCPNDIDPVVSIALAKVLKVNKSITLLSFFDGICDEAIFEALSDYNNTTLTYLKLDSSELDYTAVAAMGCMLKTNNALSYLSVVGCHIKSDGAILIGDSLKHNTALKSLNLSQNVVTDNGAIAIANGIKENRSSSLNKLHLFNTGIGIAGARSIASMLVTNTSLIDLNLGANIGKEGVIMIVEALKRNESLTKLNLRQIPIGDDGAEHIAALLTTNTSLKELDISSCCISEHGATKIFDVLNFTFSLEFLSLSFNPIGWSFVSSEVLQMLEMNSTLKELYIVCLEDNTPISEEVAEDLLKTLEDYNDTVYIGTTCYMNFDNAIQQQVEMIGNENRQGTRIARKSRRSIFNGLKRKWSEW